MIIIAAFFSEAMALAVGVPAEFADYPPDSFPQILWRAGFWDARVDSVHGDTVFVSPGQAYIAHKITVYAESTKIQVLAQENIIIRPGDTLTAELIARQESRFISLCEDNGFPFAYCEHSFRGNGNNTEVHFHIDPGELVRLARIEPEIEGKTRPGVIAHLMLFKPNMMFSRAEIFRATARLRRAGIVTVSGEPYPALAPDGKWVLVLHCRDIPTTSASGVVGYYEGEFSGNFEFTSKNLFGTGRKVSFEFRADARTKEIEISYAEPFVFSANVSPEFGTKWLIAESSYVRREHTLGVKIPLSYETDWYLGVLAGRTTPDEANPDGTNQENYGAEMGVSYSSLDDAVLPGNGIFLKVSASGEYQRSWGGEDLRQFGATGSGNFLIARKKGRFTIWLKGATWGWILPNLVDRSRWEFLGGWQNLRGYRQNQFAGIRIFWGTIEPRFILARGVHIFPFADIGGYRDLAGWNIKYSCGAGIEYRYRGGVFSIEYGIGEGVPLTRGLLHFGIRMNM